MNAEIKDALALLDAAVIVAESHNLPATAAGIQEARAAVAELVAAAGNVLADWEYCGSPGIPGGIIGKSQLVLLKDALAKFGGGL